MIAVVLLVIVLAAVAGFLWWFTDLPPMGSEPCTGIETDMPVPDAEAEDSWIERS